MNKKQLLNIGYWVIFAALVGAFAYTKGWVFTNFESITAEQAFERIKGDEKTLIVDVRTPDEFAQGHIKGAILIPLQTLEQNLGLLGSVKTQKIIVYCHSGNRSVAASRLLVKNGFTPLNLKGGISEWSAKGLPTVQ
jgi:rhodanese-related sulfurtransferase